MLNGNSDDPLVGIFNLQDGDIDQLIKAAVHGLTTRVKSAIKNGRDAMKAAESDTSANRGSKFTGSMKGGDLEDFYSGVTGVVGEPHVNLEKGVRKEHEDMADSEKSFTTNNYGITTTPKKEYQLHVEFPGIGGDDVKVAGTRRCSTFDGKSQEDLRTLRPIDYFLKLDTVKKVALTWVEVLAVILYTGRSRLWVWLSE